MKVMVTGATGFVGWQVVNRLLQGGHSVIAVARDIRRAEAMPWYFCVEFVACDLATDFMSLLQNRDIPTR